MVKSFCRLGAALVLVTHLLAAHAVQGVQYVSSPGDWVGSGRSGTIAGSQVTAISAYGDARTAHVSVSGNGEYWTFIFAVPEGATLAAGNRFAAAHRYPVNSPTDTGMEVTGNGNACNTLLGWFEVLDYQLDAHGKLSSLAIDFVQNCEVTMPPLFGSVRVASDVPLAVPLLGAVAGRDFDMVSGETASLDGTQSFTRKRSALTYRWAQVAGPSVNLKGATTATPTFKGPKVPHGGATLQFRLEVTAATGRSDSDAVFVLVENPKDPRTQLQVQGDPGDYVTLGRAWSFDGTNAKLEFATNGEGGITLNIAAYLPWWFEVAPPSGMSLQPGTYLNAQRYPTQPAGVPGLEFVGEGRGCNVVTGQYTVYQAEFDASGQPSKLDIAFEQHCEGGPPAARGEVLLHAVPHKTVATRLLAARAAAAQR
jgi:hypothetical protein